MNQENALESPVVSAVTLDKNVAKVTLRGTLSSSVMTDAFGKLALAQVNVDVIVYDKYSEIGASSVGFTVTRDDLSRAVDALEDLQRTKSYPYSIETMHGLSKVSAVGLGMSSHSGVAGRVFQALMNERIEIIMVSTSEIKISCLLAEKDGEPAMRALHAAFFEPE